MDATEFGAYMSLLISCYQSENKLPNDDKRLCRMARVTPKVWRRIKPIIECKFTKSDLHWSHLVVQKEIERCFTLSTKNKANALKKNNTSKPVGERSHSQTAANTRNKEQRIKNSIPPITPKGVDEGLWNDFLEQRKKLKCRNTERALNLLVNKIEGLAQS